MPIGRIAGVFGIRGELKCDPTPAGRDLFVTGAEFECIRASDVSTRRNREASDPRNSDVSNVRLASVRPHGSRLLIRIEGVEDADAAASFAGAGLRAPRDRLTMTPDEFLDEDLIGCDVVGGDGFAYGRVTAVEHYPASDMLIVNGTMVPMVSAIVKSIDVGAKRIIIDPPLDLFPSP